MTRKNRIFTSFAIEDKASRDLLVGQARNEDSPFEFVDMSVKQPWDSSWKTNCRVKIKGCDGTIALISRNTARAEGQLWEIQCSKAEGIPVLGIYIQSNNRPTVLPTELNDIRVVNWTWANISNFINSL
jgi:hypothetical protein